VPDAESLYDKKFTFELRVKDCPDYPACTEVLTIPKPSTPPPVICKESLVPSVSLITIPGTKPCECEGGTSSDKHEEYEVKINFNLCSLYVAPLTYNAINLNTGMKYASNVLFDSGSGSHGNGIKYPLDSALYGNRVHFTLIDAAGTVFLDRIITFPAPPKPTIIPAVPLVWRGTHSVEREGCENPAGYVDLWLNCAKIPAGTTIELTEAPNGYTFKTVYDIGTDTWTTTKNSSDFSVTNSAGSCMFTNRMEFAGLFHYGKYTWRITDNSGRDTLVTHTISDLAHAVEEPLSFTSKKTCHGTMYYPHAQVVSFPFNERENTTNLTTKFRVLKGNKTGYEINGGTTDVGIANRDSILITKSGQYIIQSFYNPKNSPEGDIPDKDLATCTVSLDTIDYVKQTISYDDYGGSLCANGKNSTIQGRIYISVREDSGISPYTFYLYGGKDSETGELIGVQTSSSNSVTFEDIKAPGAEFFARVEDACQSSFPIKIDLSPIIITNVVAGDLNVCRGFSAHLWGKMIGASHNVQYQWNGSDGFSSNARQITTPPISSTATYTLEISGLGCRIFDSITVQPVDTIQVYYEDLICKGTAYSGGEFGNALPTATLPAGVYHFSSDTLPASNGGCDSIAHLKLRIIEEREIIEYATVCSNELPYLLMDTIFSRGTPSGVYTIERMKNACPYRLQLTVHPVLNDTLPEVQICDGEQVMFHGKPYTKSGYYTDTLTCQTTGCDSLVTLHLTVNPLHTTEIYDSIYVGDAYSRYNFSLPLQTEIGKVTDSQLTKNVYGCDSTVLLYLEVLSPEVVIPEGFSPNGDGMNDYFVIKNIHLYPDNRFLIFNRWGNKLYEGKPYMNRWDGKNYFGGNVGGDDLPVGTYYYILELGKGYKEKTGFIYLNR
jgi:gliding motility-associated-like protein